MLYSLPSLYINQSFPLTFWRREKYISIFFSKGGKKFLFSTVRYLSVFVIISHAHLIRAWWPPVLKFDLKKENPKRLQSSDMLTTQQGPLFSCRSFINGACEVGCGDLDNSCPDTLNVVKSRFTVCLIEGAHFRGSCVSVWHCWTIDIFSCPVSQIISSRQPDPAVSEVWTQSKKVGGKNYGQIVQSLRIWCEKLRFSCT